MAKAFPDMPHAASQLLEQQRAKIKAAFNAFVRHAQEIDVTNDIEAVLAALDQPILNFANAWIASFISAANKTTAHLSPKLVRKAAPTVELSFNVADERAVELMRRNRLNLITNLSRQQRNIIRRALTEAQQKGLGTAATARLFRDSIGLSDRDFQAVENYRATLQRQQSKLERELAGDTPFFEPEDNVAIERRASAYARQLRTNRAEAISSTEALSITGKAQDEALRQSLEATGQSSELTGKEWRTTMDGREREAHAERNGARRRLDEEFAPGIYKPGDGDAAEAVRCRCVLTYEFFDTEEEMQAWIQGGS